jgi:hypothetical protein
MDSTTTDVVWGIFHKDWDWFEETFRKELVILYFTEKEAHEHLEELGSQYDEDYSIEKLRIYGEHNH